MQEIPFTQGDSPERNTWICEHFHLTNAKVQANLEKYLQMPQIQMEMPKDVSTEAAQLSWMTELAAKRSATGWTHFCTLLHTFNCRVPCVFLDYQILTDFELFKDAMITEATRSSGLCAGTRSARLKPHVRLGHSMLVKVSLQAINYPQMAYCRATQSCLPINHGVHTLHQQKQVILQYTISACLGEVICSLSSSASAVCCCGPLH